ncbi:hypothetical protein ATZ36_08300 [Candidatus Endomicrobiellum trichonymphae]|uniref:Uncharacterized protein n=1 Tax=Endomicrobium trichonymphae TaxID=1408204 RepID=A0A1E5IGR0_ENDTX|nr:hypothetical protein ATZ36_08300 [Candidatus Endomicrobium trichonymphae]
MYFLNKGDSSDGSMCNIAGILAQQKLIRTLLSNLSIMGIDYQWFSSKTENWENKHADDFAIEENLKALSWISSKGKSRVVAFNLNIPVVRNNADICLFKSAACLYKEGNIADDLKNRKAALIPPELMNIGKREILH